MSLQDASLTTPLHLAALVGAVECVEALIARGHVVDCRDAKGWSPLLYAHFEDHQDSVLALMKARPQQVTGVAWAFLGLLSPGLYSCLYCSYRYLHS